MKTKQFLFNRLLIGALVIVLALLTLNPLPAYAQSSVSIGVNPTSETVQVGDIFDVTVQVAAGMQSVDGAEIHLIFNPAFLRVQSLTKGTSLPTAIFEPTFDNGAGTIDYAAGMLFGSYPFGTFDLLTITFEAQAATTGTALTFNTLQHPVTDVSFGGFSILGSVADGLVVIEGIEQYTLQVDIVGNGSVTLNPAGGTYADGTVVQLTAHADPGWEFSGWSDDLSGNTNPETLTMDADKIVAAIFTESVTGDVSITKAQKTDDSAWTEDPLSVLWGDTISYSLAMTNTFEDAVDLMIGDALSGLVDYVGGTLSGAIYEGDTLVNLVDVGEAIFSGGWWFSGLDAGQTLVIFFDVVVKDEDIVAAGSWIDNMAWIDVYIDQDKVIDHKWSNTVKSEVVPEPATVFFFGIGLFGIFALLRRRRR